MKIRSSKNFFRVPKPPVEKFFDSKLKKWSIKDKEDFVIADCLTKEYASVMEQSINLVGTAAALLKILTEQEGVMQYKKDISSQQKSMREITMEKINEFLINGLGFEKESQDSSQNIREWARSLMKLPEDYENYESEDYENYESIEGEEF